MHWLVTGGAGYIGAHLVHALAATGVDIVVLDDFSTGRVGRLTSEGTPGTPSEGTPGRSSNTPSGVLIEQGSLLDARVRDRVFGTHPITGVVHLAAKKRVDESVEQPSLYYRENVEGLRRLLDSCVAAGVQHFLFSSSAAVYGDTGSRPITESTPCLPVSPYGQTKLAGEWLTHAVGAAAGMNTLALRYFNVAGTAAPELADHHGMNLVPRILRAIAAGQPPEIFGADYPTSDGTCVRDYVHVSDVADAHVAAVQTLQSGSVKGPLSLNIGTGDGVSVREMVDIALDVTGSGLRPAVGPRRPGDPPIVVAAVDRAAEVLQWRSRYGVREMIESAWQARPGG